MNGKAKVFRFDPLIDAEPYYKEYSFCFAPGLTVLDVLNQIYEQQDATLAYTYCCRNGHCGICGVTVNHKPVLMCKQAATVEMIIEPLQNISVKKDLIIDREE
jgi:succinate dehydrogenase/fumarate reductase iron-sulfur protein